MANGPVWGLCSLGLMENQPQFDKDIDIGSWHEPTITSLSGTSRAPSNVLECLNHIWPQQLTMKTDTGFVAIFSALLEWAPTKKKLKLKILKLKGDVLVTCTLHSSQVLNNNTGLLAPIQLVISPYLIWQEQIFYSCCLTKRVKARNV